jgi:hypothetical protein
MTSITTPGPRAVQIHLASPSAASAAGRSTSAPASPEFAGARRVESATRPTQVAAATPARSPVFSRMAATFKQDVSALRDTLGQSWRNLDSRTKKAAAIFAFSVLIGGIVVAAGAANVGAIGIAAAVGLGLAMAYYVKADREENPTHFGRFGAHRA